MQAPVCSAASKGLHPCKQHVRISIGGCIPKPSAAAETPTGASRERDPPLRRHFSRGQHGRLGGKQPAGHGYGGMRKALNSRCATGDVGHPGLQMHGAEQGRTEIISFACGLTISGACALALVSMLEHFYRVLCQHADVKARSRL